MSDHWFLNDNCLAVFTTTSTGSTATQGWINPTSIKESIDAEYSKRAVLGLSHSVAQYIRTNSRKIQMELWISAHVLTFKGREALTASGPDSEVILQPRNFFESLLVPAARAQGPERVNIYWANGLLTFEGVLESMSTDYERFAYNGVPLEYKMDLSFLETPTGLMTAVGVREHGLGYKAYAAAPKAMPKYKSKKKQTRGKKPPGRAVAIGPMFNMTGSGLLPQCIDLAGASGGLSSSAAPRMEAAVDRQQREASEDLQSAAGLFTTTTENPL